MGKILKKMNVLLDKKQKRSMVLLVIMMIIGAGLQVAGVGMIVPVVNVVMNSDATENNELVRTLYEILGGGSKQRFTVIIMLGLIGIFIVKNVFLYFQQKFMYAFVYTNQFRTSERMMKNYLRRGYEFYLNADTAVVQRNITSDVNNMYALILSVLQLISDAIIFVFLVFYCRGHPAEPECISGFGAGSGNAGAALSGAEKHQFAGGLHPAPVPLGGHFRQGE